MPRGAFAARNARACRRRMAINQIRHLAGHAVGGHPERLVDMDVALCDAAGGMSKQRSDRQFGKAKITREAGEGVPQGVGRDVGEVRLFADPLQHAHHADKKSHAPVGRKKEGWLRGWLLKQ